jgi:hypothetical protein
LVANISAHSFNKMSLSPFTHVHSTFRIRSTASRKGDTDPAFRNT